jgi:hypothetical protein
MSDDDKIRLELVSSFQKSVRARAARLEVTGLDMPAEEQLASLSRDRARGRPRLDGDDGQRRAIPDEIGGGGERAAAGG